MKSLPLKSTSKQSGATSILVIVMMVVLIVLGLAILTTSLSGVRLAQKKQSWLISYYTLEKEAAYARHELTTALEPLLQDPSPTKITQSDLEALQTSIKKGRLKVEAPSATNTAWKLMLEVDDEASGIKRYLTTTLILDTTKKLPEALQLQSYRQWQDAFEFKNLPGFEDPLTTPPVFDLEEAGE